tara:strand:- start:251 stop:1123 length:873 start_codon:yes stop_codon:yes gene_type:complete
MKNIFFIFLLTFYPFNLIAADYSKLPTIQEKLFNHKQIDLACFKDEKYLGLLVYNGDLNLVQFYGWKIEDASVRLDTSSKERLINFPLIDDHLELHSLDLNNFSLKISHYENLDLLNPNKELLKAVEDKTLFNHLKFSQPSKIEDIQCGVTWTYSFRSIKKNKEIINNILNEASNLSNKTKCVGEDKLKWDNCVGYKEGREFSYIGEYKDGWMDGNGIEFKMFGYFYIGEFFEDYKEGKGTEYFSAWHENIDNYPTGNTAWTVTGIRKEGEWSEDNEIEPYEAIKRFSFF